MIHLPAVKSEEQRFQRFKKLLDEHVPKAKSVLYVGANPVRALYIDFFFDCNITFLEIWPPNANGLKELLVEKKDPKQWSRWMPKATVKKLRECKIEIVQGDVSDFKLDRKFDISFWYDGPEHVATEKLPQAFKNLEDHTNNVIIAGCPWGNAPGGKKGFPYETHVSHSDATFFEQFGYHVEAHGVKDKGGYLISTKVL